MIKERIGKVLLGVELTAMICLLVSSPLGVTADPLRSTNYQFNEMSLGGIGSTGSASTNYQSNTSGGALGIGNSASANKQIFGGNATTNDPVLSFSIVSGAVSFGEFSPSVPATATATFQVSDYTSYGYVVQIIGTPPKNGSRTIANMSSNGPSQAGTEQFGINLVANTSPISIGANPDHGQFGFGNAASNYNTTNSYRYVSGDTIVTGPKSSGVTVYTITYLINVSGLTPGGQYTSNQTIICTGTY